MERISLITILNIILTLILLHFVLYPVENYVIDFDRLLSILGLTITVIAFLVACYFLTIAVSIYDKFSKVDKAMRNVEKVSDKSSEILKKITVKKKENETLTVDVVELLIDFINEHIFLIENGFHSSFDFDEKRRKRIERRRDKLIKKRSITALQYPMKDKYRRQQLIMELVAVANDEDMGLLELSFEKEKDQEIKESIQFVLNELATQSYSVPT